MEETQNSKEIPEAKSAQKPETKSIDYDQIINQFGSQRITEAQISRIERLTKKPVHHFLKRGFFYSHRDLDEILNLYEQGKKFYLYTGRGPSSSSMHLGHLVPFLMTKYLQEAFNVPLVIQMSDDEKFTHKDLSLEQIKAYTEDNIKDIIAIGFNPQKTFIFSNLDYIAHLYPNILKIQKATPYNQCKAIFGLSDSDNLGKSYFPSVQVAPSFASSFNHPSLGNTQILPDPKMPCLIPCAIDQDPYFRLARDLATHHSFQSPKPALIHSKFFPSLESNPTNPTKMSSSITQSQQNHTIFLTDTPKQIKDKIQRSFSGGQPTAELQKLHGANLEIDLAYQYLTFFHPDDQQLQQIADDYRTGKIMTGTVKNLLITLLQQLIQDHQTKKKLITPADMTRYQTIRSLE